MKLAVKLPTGSIQWVTKIIGNDLVVDIYPEDALEIESIDECKRIYPNMEFKMKQPYKLEKW